MNNGVFLVHYFTQLLSFPLLVKNETFSGLRNEREIAPLLYLSGYGHITPKTVGGKIVTMIYAIGGMPLFFLWMAQTGELMANVFKVLYYSVFCGLCRRAKRRKAAALQAAKNEREKEEAKETIIDTTSIDLESEMPFSEGGAVKVLAATPLQLAHNLINTTK